eukprot:7347969-Prymnesium_polylepis.2
MSKEAHKTIRHTTSRPWGASVGCTAHGTLATARGRGCSGPRPAPRPGGCAWLYIALRGVYSVTSQCAVENGKLDRLGAASFAKYAFGTRHRPVLVSLCLLRCSGCQRAAKMRKPAHDVAR